MDVTPLVRKGQQIIQSYTGGGFKVSGQSYAGPIVVFPHETFAWDAVQGFDMAHIKPEHFGLLIEQSNEIDVVLFGSGVKIQFLPSDLKLSFKNKGLHIESMDTGAACRTYNVLMAEGRRVVAALLPA